MAGCLLKTQAWLGWGILSEAGFIEVVNPGDGAGGWGGQHLSETPARKGATQGKMLFVFLFLIPSEVSGGTNKVISKETVE